MRVDSELSLKPPLGHGLQPEAKTVFGRWMEAANLPIFLKF